MLMSLVLGDYLEYTFKYICPLYWPTVNTATVLESSVNVWCTTTQYIYMKYESYYMMYMQT